VMSVLILRHFDDGGPEDTTPTTSVGAPAWVT